MVARVVADRAIAELAPLLDLAELSPAMVTERWQSIMRLLGWDGVDSRCRIDTGGRVP